MSDQDQLESNEDLIDIQSILSSVEHNRFWPFAEGVYVLDELKPWAAAAYTFIVMMLEDKAARDKYNAAVFECDERLSKQFRNIVNNLLTKYPLYGPKKKGLSDKALTSAIKQWHKQFNLIMKQYFAEKGHILDKAIDRWLKEYFKPDRGEFGTIIPMSGILHAAIIYETISCPLVEEPPEGYKPQEFYDDAKPTKEFVQFLQPFRCRTGIDDPGTWQALRESEFYKALNMSREMSREIVNEEKSILFGIHCYGDRTLLRNAYAFKRVVLDGKKEAEVAEELCSFRQAAYDEAKRIMTPYQVKDGHYYLTKAVRKGAASRDVLAKLFTSKQIKLAPKMFEEWLAEAKKLPEDYPTENEVSKFIIPFVEVFKYPRKSGRPKSTT